MSQLDGIIVMFHVRPMKYVHHKIFFFTNT